MFSVIKNEEVFIQNFYTILQTTKHIKLKSLELCRNRISNIYITYVEKNGERYKKEKENWKYL